MKASPSTRAGKSGGKVSSSKPGAPPGPEPMPELVRGLGRLTLTPSSLRGFKAIREAKKDKSPMSLYLQFEVYTEGKHLRHAGSTVLGRTGIVQAPAAMGAAAELQDLPWSQSFKGVIADDGGGAEFCTLMYTLYAKGTFSDTPIAKGRFGMKTLVFLAGSGDDSILLPLWPLDQLGGDAETALRKGAPPGLSPCQLVCKQEFHQGYVGILQVTLRSAENLPKKMLGSLSPYVKLNIQGWDETKKSPVQQKAGPNPDFKGAQFNVYLDRDMGLREAVFAVCEQATIGSDEILVSRQGAEGEGRDGEGVTSWLLCNYTGLDRKSVV